MNYHNKTPEPEIGEVDLGDIFPCFFPFFWLNDFVQILYGPPVTHVTYLRYFGKKLKPFYLFASLNIF